MPIILVLKRLLRLPNDFIYTMLPKEGAAVHAADVDYEEERSADETPETPGYRPWSRQT